MNSNDYVAEHVMGLERGNCWSTTGSTSSRPDGTFETWFSCNWCGQVIHNGKIKPCPQYPFPKFTLVDLMRKLGEEGDPVMVRYDAQRLRHNFTVTVHTTRVADTDDPLQALCDHLYRHQSLYSQKRKRFVSGEQMEFEPGYGWREAAPDWGPPCLRSECCFRWRHCNIPPAVKEPSPAFFANIRDAIRLLRKAMGQVEGKQQAS